MNRLETIPGGGFDPDSSLVIDGAQPMPLWMRYAIALVFFLITGMVGIWAIREGGSFAFLTPWRRPPEGRRPGDED